MNANVTRMNRIELARHLEKRGMEEWERLELLDLTGEERQDAYYIWSEWQRAIECNKMWRECQHQIDSTSIFFPAGFTEKFREISEMIADSNVENETRIRYYKQDRYRAGFDEYALTTKLRKEGNEKMKELESMVRDRLWSVAKDGA